MKKIAITGASGFIGQHAVSYLIASGYEVIALVRNAQSAKVVESYGATSRFWDTESLESTIDALQGMDAIVHLAARFELFGSYQDFYKDNFLLTERLLEAGKVAGIKLFVHIGAAAVALGSPTPFPLTEIAPIGSKPAGAYGTSKALAEKMVLSKADINIRCIVLRPPLVWAANAPFFSSIIDAVHKKQFLWIDGGNYVVSTLHVQNLASAINAALRSKEANGVFFISDGEEIKFRELVNSFLSAKGLNASNISLPRWVALAGAWSAEQIWKLFRLSGRPPFTQIMIDLIGQEFRIDDTKARDTLGYKNRISIVEGLAQFKEQPLS